MLKDLATSLALCYTVSLFSDHLRIVNLQSFINSNTGCLELQNAAIVVV